MSLDDHSRSLYSSFNARALSPTDVAKTFVPPACFFQLANKCHTFVIGPRGSGKTTLLKMLEQPAIESWDHENAHELRRQVEFTAVYIPTDVTFTSQLEKLTQGFDEKAAILRAAYSIHVMRSIVQSIEYKVGRVQVEHAHHPHLRLEMSSKQEQDFVLELAAAFNRDVRIPTFGSLKICLSKWLGDIYELARQHRTASHSEQQDAVSASGILQLDISRSSLLAIDCFESICGIAHTRWALLFDELELAPVVIVKELTRLVRSTDPRMLFKLSLSPYISDTTEIDTLFQSGVSPPRALGHDESDSIPPAQEHEDFDAIRLWAPYKKSGQDFCRELANSVIQKKGFQNATIESVLGSSDFDEPDPASIRRGEAYEPGSRHNRRMTRLSEFDNSFRHYLKRKDIDLTKKLQRDDMRAKTLRKVQGIVIVREAFRKETGGRSRKNPDLYSGAKIFYTLSESNPRLIIGLLNQLLSGFDPTEEPHRVDPSKQAAVYSSATARFLAYLRTIPSPKIKKHGEPRGLLDFVNRIGGYFFHEVVTGEFSDDPHTSFTVDAATPMDLQVALQRAVNAGAIIWVPTQDDSTLLTSVKGKRFRLSYLLAPRFCLPIQLGRSISLKRILRGQENSSAELPGFEDDEE